MKRFSNILVALGVTLFLMSVGMKSEAEAQPCTTILDTMNLGVWQRVEIPFDSINCLDVILHNDTLFAGALKYGMLYSTSEGATWDILSHSLIEKYRTSPRHLYKNEKLFGAILSGNDAIIVSSDGGKTWDRNDIGIYSSRNPPINDGILFDDKFILASDIGLIYTTDSGESWTNFKGGDLDSGEHSSYVLFDENNYLYASTLKGFLKSEDKGDTWNIIIPKNNLIDAGIYAYLKVENGYIYGYNSEYNIVRTSDLGNTWNLVGESFVGFYANQDIIRIGNSLVAIVGGGVAVSHNDGKTKEEYYIPFNKPDGNPYVFEQCVVQGNYIIAATQMGILRAKLSDLGIEVKSTVESEIERNYLYTYPPYPNPAKSEVKVLFYWDINLPMTTDDISIYDIKGKKIDAVDKLSLVKQESHYGNIIWDCSSAQPGIYLINIKHGTEEKAVKVVVE